MYKYSSRSIIVICILGAIWLRTSVYSQCKTESTSASVNDFFVSDYVKDPYGNLYLVGVYRNTVNIQHLTFESDQLAGLIVKYDKSGNVLWGISTVNFDRSARITKVALTDNHDVIITGSFFASQFNLQCETFINDGSRSNIYISKISKQGEVLWGQYSSGSTDKYITSLVIGSDQSIIIGGNFVGSNNFSFGTVSTNGFSGYDMFVSKFDKDGNPLWLRSFGGTDPTYDYINGLTVDTDENIIFTGVFTGQNINFDGTIFQPGNISENYFIAKLNPIGEIVWAKKALNTGVTWGSAITSDQDNNIYTTGRFVNEDMLIDGFTLNNNGEGDIFLLKYSQSGDVLWVRNFGGSDYDQGVGLIYHASNKIALMSWYQSDEINISGAIFGSGNRSANTLITELDLDGNVLCNYDFNSALYREGYNPSYDSLANIVFLQIDDLVDENLIFLGNDTSWTSEDISGTQLSLSLGDDLVLCFPETRLIELSLPCSATALWSDGSTGDQYDISETSQVWVEVSYQGQVYRDTVQVSYEFPPNAIDLEDVVICSGTSYMADVSDSQAEDYLWNDGAESSIRELSDAGLYWVKVINSCFMASDTFRISVIEELKVNLGQDTTLCEGISLALSAADASAIRYEWSNGEKSPAIHIDDEGTYTVEVSNNCESVSDTINVSRFEASDLFIPNVITPNGDNFNENFIIPTEIMPASLSVYNRWGEQVYHSENYDNSWRGKGLASSTYYYNVRSQECLEESLKGRITVIK
ncbi:MAG: gliding motility-associated C-terminal domain-containing protein [Bacteroidota bacterium]